MSKNIEYHTHYKFFAANKKVEKDNGEFIYHEFVRLDIAECENENDALQKAKEMVPGRKYYHLTDAFQCASCIAHENSNQAQLLHLKMLMKVLGKHE